MLTATELPITRGGYKVWQRPVPGAQDQLHAVAPNAEHVLQEGEGEGE